MCVFVSWSILTSLRCGCQFENGTIPHCSFNDLGFLHQVRRVLAATFAAVHAQAARSLGAMLDSALRTAAASIFAERLHEPPDLGSVHGGQYSTA